MSESRTCTKCNIEKNLSEFYSDVKGKFGKMAVCKTCNSVRHKERMIAIKEANREPSHSDMAMSELVGIFRRIAADGQLKKVQKMLRRKASV